MKTADTQVSDSETTIHLSIEVDVVLPDVSCGSIELTNMMVNLYFGNGSSKMGY